MRPGVAARRADLPEGGGALSFIKRRMTESMRDHVLDTERFKVFYLREPGNRYDLR